MEAIKKLSSCDMTEEGPLNLTAFCHFKIKDYSRAAKLYNILTKEFPNEEYQRLSKESSQYA